MATKQQAYSLLENEEDVEAAPLPPPAADPQATGLSPKEDAERRRQLYKERVGEAGNLSFCKEHYCRLPRRKCARPKMSNLFGLMNTPFFQALEIFSLIRVLAVWDVASDILVTSLIDPHEDPWWFSISIFLIALPVILKGVLFHSLTLQRFPRSLRNAFESCGLTGGGQRCVETFLYILVAPFMFFFIDAYLLLLFPWVTPTDTAYLGTLERLSPLIETFFEGSLQSTFQLYMWVRVKFLPWHKQSSQSLPRVLLLSFLPAMIGMLKKLLDLRADAKATGMPLLSYIAELFKGPLGISAPFLTLLNKRSAVHYAGMGVLTRHQDSIFAAIGPDNATLNELTFDDGNGIHLDRLASAIEGNVALGLLAVGSDQDFEAILEFVSRVPERDDFDLGICGQILGLTDRKRFLKEVDDYRSRVSLVHAEASKVGPDTFKIGSHGTVGAIQKELLSISTQHSKLLNNYGLTKSPKEQKQVTEEIPLMLQTEAARVLQRWMRRAPPAIARSRRQRFRAENPELWEEQAKRLAEAEQKRQVVRQTTGQLAPQSAPQGEAPKDPLGAGSPFKQAANLIRAAQQRQ